MRYLGLGHVICNLRLKDQEILFSSKPGPGYPGLIITLPLNIALNTSSILG